MSVNSPPLHVEPLHLLVKSRAPSRGAGQPREPAGQDHESGKRGKRHPRPGPGGPAVLPVSNPGRPMVQATTSPLTASYARTRGHGSSKETYPTPSSRSLTCPRPWSGTWWPGGGTSWSLCRSERPSRWSRSRTTSDRRAAEPRAAEDEIAKFRIYPTVIPAYTYGVEPPSPPAPLPTFGPRLLLVANPAVSSEAVRLVLEAIFSGDFRPVLPASA